jgi:coenzyme Q-binding protein COQ10
MPNFAEKFSSAYSPKQLYDLVRDIEKYPEFLPWCGAARILKQEGNIIYADLVISYKVFQEKYTSKVTCNFDEQEQQGTILVELVEGPFSHLQTKWEFKSASEGSLVEFSIDFKFHSLLLEKLVSSVFQKAVHKLVTAFKAQAKAIYSC